MGVFPYGIYFTADWVWGTYLATLLLAFAFLLALELEYTGRPLKWLGFGALCGVATLTEPSVLSVYMHHKLQQGTAYISEHKTFFAWMSFRRAVYLWTGFWSLSRGYLHEGPLDPANIVVCTALTVLALLGLGRAFRNGLAKQSRLCSS